MVLERDDVLPISGPKEQKMEYLKGGEQRIVYVGRTTNKDEKW